MSKLHSSLQKAIEKSRKDGGQATGTTGANRSSRSQQKSDGIASGIFRMLQLAKPHNHVMERSKIVAAIDDRAAKSAYNVLRTRVLQRMRSNNWRSLLVTSPGAGEGKTLTASNLAISLARDVNQSSTLIDLDLMRSSVAKYLGIDIDMRAGIGDYLLGKAEVSEIMYSSGGIDRLVLVPNREPVENSSDLISSPRMHDLVAELNAQADGSIVIYDMPPVLAHDDVLAFCPYVDAVLLVVAQGKTERTALDKAMSLLSDYEMLGVVLNMSTQTKDDNAYAYY